MWGDEGKMVRKCCLCTILHFFKYICLRWQLDMFMCNKAVLERNTVAL